MQQTSTVHYAIVIAWSIKLFLFARRDEALLLAAIYLGRQKTIGDLCFRGNDFGALIIHMKFLWFRSYPQEIALQLRPDWATISSRGEW